MVAPLSSFDAFIYPLTTTSSTRSLVFTETGGASPATNAIVNIAVGDLYALMDSPPSGYTSLYAEIETAMNAAAGNGATYTIARADAASSSAFGKAAGITITSDGAGSTTAWELDFSHGSFTLDPRWLGFPAAQSSDVVSTANVVTSTMTVMGVWIPPERASDKGPKRTIYRQGRSGGRIATRRTNRLSKRDVREFVYRYLPAGHLFTRRNQIAGSADAAGLAQNDDGNYFADLHELGFAADKDVFVIHDLGGTAADITAANGYEIIRIDESAAEQSDDVLSMLRKMRAGGEYYELTFTAYLVASTYIYD